MFKRSTSDKKCFRCGASAEEYREIWHLIGQREGFCDRCIFDLLKLVMTVEMLSAEEVD